MSIQTKLRGLALSAIAYATGCAVQTADDPEVVSANAQAVISGTTTFARVAVGQLGNGCSASLISSRVILTASHCLGFDTSQSYLGTGGSPPTFPSIEGGMTFTMYPAPPATPMELHIKRYAVLGNNFGGEDIAVAELDGDVPSSFATPLPIAPVEPANGASVTAYGYGCIVWGEEGAPPHRKTTRTSTWNTSTHTTNQGLNCPGDSGGPTLDTSGRIVAVHSTWCGADGCDDNGYAWVHKRWISTMNAIFGKQQLCTECKQISLRTYDGIHYLRAQNGAVTAQSTQIGTLEKFRLVPFSVSLADNFEPWFGLQASNGQWVCAEGGGGANVVADRTLPREWETFRVDLVNFLGDVNFATIGSPTWYMVAEDAGGGAVNANRSAASTWETFAMF